VRSSGSPALDQETLAILACAQPLPRPPQKLSDSPLSFEADARQSGEDGLAAGGTESGFAIQSPSLVSYLRAQHA